MTHDLLYKASALTDRELLDRLPVLAGRERTASVDLIAHLAVLDARPSLYAAAGYGSLFGYCTQVLRLSEDAACSRIDVARACRRFPVLLDVLASGALALTSVRLLAPHLTGENHAAVLARAKGLGRRQLDNLIAELAPRPDVPSSVRRLPTPRPAALAFVSASASAPLQSAAPRISRPALLPMAPGTMPPPVDHRATPSPAVTQEPSASAVPMRLPGPGPRPIVHVTSPGRYRMQFTIDEESHDRFRRLQALLRREVPDGDPAALFDIGIALALEKVEKAKLGVISRLRRANADQFRGPGPNEGTSAVRPADSASTEGSPRGATSEATADIRPRTDEATAGSVLRSRDIPRPVRRVVWNRDAEQCAFVSTAGVRCEEEAFLELHHLQAWAKGGPPTVENISLRCHLHNKYEAELVFGRDQMEAAAHLRQRS